MSDPHLAALETTIVAENWDGPVDGAGARSTEACATAGWSATEVSTTVHLRVVEARPVSDEVIELVAETTQSQVRVAVATRTRLERDGERLSLAPVRRGPRRRGRPGVPRSSSPRASRSPSRRWSRSSTRATPPSASRPSRRASGRRTIAGDFEELLRAATRSAGTRCGRTSDIDLGVDHDDLPQGAPAPVPPAPDRLRTTPSASTSACRPAACTARPTGATSSGTSCSCSRSSAPGSRRSPGRCSSTATDASTPPAGAATEAGFAGAMFPWQSASSGREETQQLHLNPESGRWLPGRLAPPAPRRTPRSRYNVWQYFQATDDLDFLRFHGAEMLLEIARFWASVADLQPGARPLRDPRRGRARRVPRRLPGRRPSPGVDNNAYTNVMAVWCLCRGLDVLDDAVARAGAGACASGCR